MAEIMNLNELEPVIETTDALTGLANRYVLERDMMDHIDRGNDFSLIICDIDKLKQYNDTKGHQAGDVLIVDTSQILVDEIRTQENMMTSRPPLDKVVMGRNVYRLNDKTGDEFVVIVGGVRDQEALDKIMNRLNDRLIGPDPSRSIYVSMGGRPYKRGEPIGNLINDADRRMYKHKRARQAYEEKYEKYLADKKYRQELKALPARKFWPHIGGVALKRLTDRYSGVKGRD